MKFITLILVIFMSFSANAADKFAANAEHIQKIEKYLNDINTLAAVFTQEDSEGGKASGMFYLSRPGRLRWDYDSPTPILIVAKGSLVAYYDKELDEVSHISLDDTLAGFLTREKISFTDKGAKINAFTKNNTETSISVSQDGGQDSANLTMVFNNENNDILRMELIDSIGKTTIIRLSSLIYNKPLAKELFVLPRVKNKIRSK